jgi:hypothetical protein
MNDLICISSIVIAIKLSDQTPNSWMWITKSITCSQLLTGTIWSTNAKPRSHVKFGLLWLDCDSQIRTKLANLWGIFDRILKNNLFDAQSFWFKKESFWFQKSSPWCDIDSITDDLDVRDVIKAMSHHDPTNPTNSNSCLTIKNLKKDSRMSKRAPVPTQKDCITDTGSHKFRTMPYLNPLP